MAMDRDGWRQRNSEAGADPVGIRRPVEAFGHLRDVDGSDDRVGQCGSDRIAAWFSQ